jgi:hypothetical protein
MVAVQSVITRQEFMKQMSVSSLKETETLRLPFIYTAMDEACFIQAEQICSTMRGLKNRVISRRSFSEWAV